MNQQCSPLFYRARLALVAFLFLNPLTLRSTLAKDEPSEVYATASDGALLHWTVYTPVGTGPWPAVLVIHGGHFKGGDPTSSPESITCGRDLAAAGFIAFSIEYRLAPNGALLDQVTSGQFPDQSDDVKLAVLAARNDARCNGQVGSVGGSAGGYHTAFVAATGSALLGFTYMLAFSLGMTAILVAVGVSAGALAALPRSGQWMLRLKRAGGVLLLIMAQYYIFQAGRNS